MFTHYYTLISCGSGSDVKWEKIMGDMNKSNVIIFLFKTMKEHKAQKGGRRIWKIITTNNDPVAVDAAIDKLNGDVS